MKKSLISGLLKKAKIKKIVKKIGKILDFFFGFLYNNHVTQSAGFYAVLWENRIHFSRPEFSPQKNTLPVCWNWQTRRTQNPLPAMACGFKSHHRHQGATSPSGACRFFILLFDVTAR